MSSVTSKYQVPTREIKQGPRGFPGPGGTTAQSGGAWGEITGSIADQTDLVNLIGTKAPINQPVLNGMVTIYKDAHLASSEANLELFSEDTGDGSKFISLRFHQSMQFYNCIRSNYSGFYLTAGISEDLVPLNLSNLNATGNIAVLGQSLFSGDVSYLANAGSETFASGWTGSGWQVTNNIGVYHATFDELTIRGSLNVYELQVNKIRATNGSLWVSDAAVAAADMSYSAGAATYYFTVEDSSMVTFAVDDIVRTQAFNGSSVYAFDYRVSAVDTNKILLKKLDGTNVPLAERGCKGRTFVRIGNVSNAARQNAIYLTASDTNNPYMDVLAGVNSASFTGKTRVRMGNLAGITDADFGGALSGYGLYADNVFLKGKIVIAAGTTGYANITDKPTIPTNTNQLTDGAGLGLTAVWSGLADMPGRFADTPAYGAGLYVTASYLGYWNGSAWNSYIDSAGNCRFVGVSEFGTSTQDYGGGKLQSLAIKGSDIWENAYADNASGVKINRIGYAGGSSYYRDCVVYDGKGTKLLQVVGSRAEVIVGNPGYTNATLEVAGTVNFTAASNINFGGNHVVATGTSDTTCSTTETDLANMSASFTPKGSKVLITFSAAFDTSSADQGLWLFMNVGGVTVRAIRHNLAAQQNVVSFCMVASVTPSSAVTIKMRWRGTTAISQKPGLDGYRVMTITDLY